MKLRVLLALIAGLILPFAFAPTGIFLLAAISPAILLFTWHDARPKQAFIYGLIYGLGLFGIGASWIYISIHFFGNTNVFFASTITGLFVLILALFIASNGYLFAKIFPTDNFSKSLIAFPCSWVIFEWIRSWIFSGFPWLLLGQSQTNSPLHGFAPVIGVYGVSFMVVLSAAALFTLFKFSHRWLSLLLILIIWAGGYGLTYVPWTKPYWNPIKVSLIQGNIPQSTKWSEAQAINSLNLYHDLTNLHWNSDLIIWPESAITIPLPNMIGYLQELSNTAEQKHAAIITGIPIPNDAENNYFNGAIVIGDGDGKYLKRHLVPFGEYVPFEKLLRGLIGFFDLPMSNFTTGPFYQPLLQVKNLQVGLFVCYEVAYPALVRSDLPGANLLVTISDDTWFGHSAALAQHRQIAQFTAQATGRYMLVATNSGDTVIINQQGKIIDQTMRDIISVLDGEAQGMTGVTPWVTFGSAPILILLVLLLCIAILRQLPRGE